MVRRGLQLPSLDTESGPGAALNGATAMSAHQGGAIGRVGNEDKASTPSASGPTRHGELVPNKTAVVSLETEELAVA